MNILYVSNTCSAKKYTEYVESKGARISQQAQKYNLLLAEGLSDNGADVLMISTRPINRTLSKKIWFKSEKENTSRLTFHYPSFVNLKGFRQACLLGSVFFKILFSKYDKKQTAIVCDGLNITATTAALWASKIRRYKTVGIVTDVPCHFSNSQSNSKSQKYNLRLMKKFDAYLLLTEQMNTIVNPKKKPHIVLEGHADLSMKQVTNLLENKYDKKICLYAGSLKRIYGIENLVRGFEAAKIPNAELHIYGNGDFVKDLKVISESTPSIKYFGIAPNSKIVEEETKATLLINPRPTNEDYTKYSFPSKNMEYMASGTPVLTTKLPGMPEDHLEHVYLIEDESADGIKNALLHVLSKSDTELHNKGKEAKAFILEKKNNVEQAKKLIHLIQTDL